MQRVLLFGVVALLAAPSVAMAQWLSLRSDHFHVVGNASGGQLRDVALRLEQFREVVGQLNPALLREDSAPPVVVVVFRNDRTYEPFMPRTNGRVMRIGGLFQPGQDVNYITLNVEARAQAYPSIFRMFAHVLLRGVFADAPVWFSQGVAEYYSTLEVTNNGRRANIGQPVPEHVGLLRERKLPFTRFFSIDRSSPEYTTNETQRELFFAQAWAIVHHAFHGTSKRRDQLLAFVSKVAAGGDTATSFREAYGMELIDLEREVQGHVQNRVYGYSAYEFPERIVTGIQSEAVRLSDAEADARLGDLLAHMRHDAEAVTYLERALKAQPDLALAHAALGTLYMRTDKTKEGRDHLQRAVALGTENEGVQFAYAYSLVTGGAPDDSSFAQASKALERAIELRPGYTDAKQLLAYTYLRTERYAAARDVLMPVVRAEPTNHRAALMLGDALLRLDDIAGARAVLGPVVGRATSESDRSRARDLLGLSAKLERRRETLAAAGLSAPGNTAPAGAVTTPPAAADSLGAPTPPVRASSRIPAFRPIGAGEQRVYGVFESVECSGNGVALVVRTADAVLRARASSLSEVELITHRQLATSSVNCGKQAVPVEVYLTWRVPDANAPAEGTAVAIEVLPEGFVP